MGSIAAVDNARIYSRPDTPPPIAVSAFGPEALEVAARIGDGFITTGPDAELVRSYRQQGGRGPTIGVLEDVLG